MRKSILFAAASILLTGSALAQGDTPGTATAISDVGSHTFDTTGSSHSGFQGALAGCASVNHDNFYQWTATVDGDYTFSLCDSALGDTKLALYSGVGLAATCIISADDTCGFRTSLDVNGVLAGDTILIQAGSFSSSSSGWGSVTLDITAAPPPPPAPANDDCANATAITSVGSFPFDPTSATDSDMVGACVGRDSNLQDVFFSFTAPSTGQFTFSTEHQSTSYDTVMAVYGGPACGPTAPCLGHNDDIGGGNYGSSVTVGASAGDVILVQVGSWGATTLLASNILTIDGPNPPANEDCGTATDLGSDVNAFPYDPRGATDSGFLGDSGCSDDASMQDVFFTWTAPADDTYTFSTENHLTSYDTRMAIYSGNACDVTSACLGSNDDAGGALEWGSSVDVGLLAGDLVTIQIGTYSSSTTLDSNILTIAGFLDPCDPMNEDAYEDNDDCASAIALPAGTYTNLFTTDTDTDWFSITVPAGEIGTVLLNQQSGDTDVTVMHADCVGVYGTIGAGFHFTNTGATAIDVMFNTWNDNSGSSCSIYDLDISFAPDPCAASNDDALEDNDDCASAVAMVDGTNTGLWISDADEDFYSYCVGNGETIVIDALFIDADGDIDLDLLDGADCSTALGSSSSVDDDEHITWTNTTGVDMDVVLRVFFWDTGCNNYDLVVSGSGNCNGVIGTMYCDAVPNSTGAIANIYGAGSIVAADNNFGLLAFGLPEGEFGYFIGSFGQAQVNNPGSSNGNLCVGGGESVARFLSTLGSVFGGQLSGSVDLTNVPLPPTFTGMILAGDTFNFQLWHRDGGALSGQSNFSRGLEVTFQ